MLIRVRIEFQLMMKDIFKHFQLLLFSKEKCSSFFIAVIV